MQALEHEKRCLRILHIEDHPLDAELIKAGLKSLGIPSQIIGIKSEKELRTEVESHKADIILSDSGLPTFDAFEALNMARQQSPAIPFIFVTGNKSPALKKKAIESGAADFVNKDEIASLPGSIRRTFSNDQQKTSKRLFPEVRQMVVVRCPRFRCLGYLDRDGSWRDFHTSAEITDVQEWYAL